MGADKFRVNLREKKEDFTQMGADFRYADGSREHQRKSARKEKEDFTQMNRMDIGNHCIKNTRVSVDIDSNVSEVVYVSPHATLCANVIVGEGTWIGAGATNFPGVSIGKWCLVC